jgi:monoamine oxidase
MSNKECVVIGAGLAGLAAAYHLTQKKWKVTVLEAAKRLGGRVMTHHFAAALKLNCELGGEWIGSDHQEMRRLCSILNLTLQKHEYANSFWNQSGRARLIAPGKWCLSNKSRRIWKRFKKDFGNFT